MLLSAFHQKLESDLKKRVKLTVNNNRSTMLSVTWEMDCTKVSMHRLFLAAPENIMDALACYIKRKDRSISPHVKSYMEKCLQQLDYSHRLNKLNLEVQGRWYNLQDLLKKINSDYFSNQLNLFITWFGGRENYSQVTFGLYQSSLRLIKINRLLDHARVPEYVISYVIYHEALHHLHPSYYDEKGRHHIHHKRFKEREKKFRDYHRAQTWIKKNREKFYGRP